MAHINAVASTPLRVLMLNRENALSNPGGDTVVMVRVAEDLKKRGVHVDIDVQRERRICDYDIVYLHNFATPEHTESLAKLCVDADVPYVVTTMYEDAPLFYNQMTAQAQAFFSYIQSGQPADRFEAFMAPVRSCSAAAMLDNTWTAGHAAALIASGAREKATLERDYPDADLVTSYRLGSDLGYADIDGSRFKTDTGLSDFVLCVGRVESRKNQLMLLKALEDSELPVVFATGGFTYQPQYAKACVAFQRKGKTIFMNRLEDNVLASAYAAARVHVLPSWYELPGIVSQEAAKRGTNVVVTDNGTARDYFGDAAYYCCPDDPQSVLSAVQEAFDSPTRQGLAESVSDCSWENAASHILDIYRQVLEST